MPHWNISSSVIVTPIGKSMQKLKSAITVNLSADNLSAPRMVESTPVMFRKPAHVVVTFPTKSFVSVLRLSSSVVFFPLMLITSYIKTRLYFDNISVASLGISPASHLTLTSPVQYSLVPNNSSVRLSYIDFTIIITASCRSSGIVVLE